jgi:hypothetical protein
MFGLLKAAVGIVTLPVDIVADVVNEVRSIGDLHSPPSHTKRKAKAIMRNIHESTE